MSTLIVSPLSFCNSECHSKYKQKQGNTQISCNYCNKEFKIKNAELKKNFNNNYCSQSCYGKSKFNGLNVKCKICLKCKYVIKSEIRDFHPNFCSKRCFEINNGVKRKHKYKKIPSYRKKALKQYVNECQNIFCILKGTSVPIELIHLDVDHINGDKQNNDINNLCILCVFCHRIKTLKKGIIKIIKNEKKL